MARHIALVKDHLPLIVSAFGPLVAAANNRSVAAGDSPSADIRLHAVRCVDMLGHHLNVYMSGDGANVPDDLNAGFAFWQTMVTVLIEQLQADFVSIAVRASACEALSNIGVYTYERLAVSTSRNLIK